MDRCTLRKTRVEFSTSVFTAYRQRYDFKNISVILAGQTSGLRRPGLTEKKKPNGFLGTNRKSTSTSFVLFHLFRIPLLICNVCLCHHQCKRFLPSRCSRKSRMGCWRRECRSLNVNLYLGIYLHTYQNNQQPPTMMFRFLVVALIAVSSSGAR